jgi:hypothetical protein
LAGSLSLPQAVQSLQDLHVFFGYGEHRTEQLVGGANGLDRLALELEGSGLNRVQTLDEALERGGIQLAERRCGLLQCVAQEQLSGRFGCHTCLSLDLLDLTDCDAWA